jgi:hypothetical protein
MPKSELSIPKVLLNLLFKTESQPLKTQNEESGLFKYKYKEKTNPIKEKIKIIIFAGINMKILIYTIFIRYKEFYQKLTVNKKFVKINLMEIIGPENLTGEESENVYLRNLLQEFGREFDPEKIKSLYLGRVYLMRRGGEYFFQKLIEFSKKLEDKYSRKECLKCLAWHILVGSTPVKEKIAFFDFEGEDSIVNFINDFYNELIEKSKEKDNR